MKKLIVGIDPGITTALAILDLDGNLLNIKSKRNFSQAGISRFILDNGKPLFLSTDRNPVPRIVEKIKSTFKTEVVYPKQSLGLVEKRKIVKRYLKDLEKGKIEDLFSEEEIKFSNRHEKDALAAAIFALRKLRPMLNKRKQKNWF